MTGRGTWLAVSAGSLAALASVFGKLGGASPTHLQAFTATSRITCYAVLTLVSCFTGCMQALPCLSSCTSVAVRQCNVGMTTVFVKSLQSLPSTHATVLSVSTNICITVCYQPALSVSLHSASQIQAKLLCVVMSAESLGDPAMRC